LSLFFKVVFVWCWLCRSLIWHNNLTEGTHAPPQQNPSAVLFSLFLHRRTHACAYTRTRTRTHERTKAFCFVRHSACLARCDDWRKVGRGDDGRTKREPPTTTGRVRGRSEAPPDSIHIRFKAAQTQGFTIISTHKK
jgi:hypothetical protein